MHRTEPQGDRARRAHAAHATPAPLSAAIFAAALAWPMHVSAQRVLGIDVSAWQTNISTADWATLKRPTTQQVNGVSGDGRDFVFIRSSRGGTTGYYNQSDPGNNNGQNTLSQRYDDPYFVQNITRATTAGFLAGAYHFSRPDIVETTPTANGVANSGADEADHFIAMAGAWMRPGYLIPVHDLEDGDGDRSDTAMAQFTLDFSNRIHEVIGVRPAIYVNGNYAEFVIGGAPSALRDQVAATHPLWSARWPNQANPSAIPIQTGHPKDSYAQIYGPWDDAPNPAHPWRFWQYASTARLNGYAGGNANIDVNVANGGMEFLKDQLVPAVWMTASDGNWSTQTNWNSGIPPVAPVQGPGQVARIGPMVLPSARLPSSTDTVVLDRPNANITVTLGSGTHTIRKLYAREALNITGGSLTIGYVPSADSTPIAAQFSAPVTLSAGSLNVHTLQVDNTQTFTLTGGTLLFNTINLMPHPSTPAKLLINGDVTLSGVSTVAGVIANGAGTGNTGFVDLGGAARTLNIQNVQGGTDLEVNVPFTNGGIVKTGTGTLALNAANTYTGVTTVQTGRIELGGSVSGTVNVTGGVLACGEATGIRAINGILGVSPGGTLRMRLNGTTAGTQHDRVNLTNANSFVTLSGALDLVAAAGLAEGSNFRIIDNSGSNHPVIGTFAGLPEGAEFYQDSQWWRISYAGGNGNDVVVTRIAATPWHAWRLANFTTSFNDSAIAGDLADAENDGFINLIEYSFNGNPTVANQTPLPKSSVAGGRLAITFTRVLANNDISILIQGADHPNGPWTNLARSANGAATVALVAGVTVTETGTGSTRSVEVRDLYLTTDANHPTRVLRVQVLRP